MVSESHSKPLHDLSAFSAEDTQECSEDRDNPSQQEEVLALSLGSRRTNKVKKHAGFYYLIVLRKA